MELRRRVEKRLAAAQEQQDAAPAGTVWAYLHGYITACERILEDITDLGIRAFEAERRV